MTPKGTFGWTLGNVVYWHCYPYDSYNKYCLSCSYGYCKRVRRVLISQYIWTQQKSISSLSEEFAAKFPDFSNFQVSWKGSYLKKGRPNQCTIFKKNWRFFFDHMRRCPHTLNRTWKISQTFSDDFIPFINFLPSKKKRTPKIGSSLKFLFLDMSCLLHKQKGLHNQIWINK